MSLLDSFKSFIDQSKAGLMNEIARFQNRRFLDTVVAACAWVAAADGKIDSAEKSKMLGFIQRSDELKVFKTNEVIDSWNAITTSFDFDVNVGISDVCKLLQNVTDVTEKRTIVLVCCAIGSADGNFDDGEKEVVRKIINVLQLNPKDFNL